MILRLLALLALLLAATAPAQGSPTPTAPTATLSVTHREGRPSLVEVQLEPRDAAGGGELFLSLTRGVTHKRQPLQPAGEGYYRLEYAFPEAGRWHVYLRYGSGQAGLLTATRMDITPHAGAVDRRTLRFADGFSRDVPAYVQPLGFAVFGLLAALAAASVVALLLWIRRQSLTLEPILPQ